MFPDLFSIQSKTALVTGGTRADVSNELQCRALVDEFTRREPELHILVNNAGRGVGVRVQRVSRHRLCRRRGCDLAHGRHRGPGPPAEGQPARAALRC